MYLTRYQHTCSVKTDKNLGVTKIHCFINQSILAGRGKQT